MPRTQNSELRNLRLQEWVDHGLKRAHWPASRVAQIGLLIGIALAVGALYLMQSSEIVAASRQVHALREQVAQLKQDNAELAVAISKDGSIEQLRQRAQAMGFQPTAGAVYLPVRYVPIDDALTIEDIYRP
jgi:hypothetical protein